jgi:hypothetical protein
VALALPFEDVEARVKALEAERGDVHARYVGGTSKHLYSQMDDTYRSQSARDAQARGYGTESYWASLDRTAMRYHDLYVARGDTERAAHMLTRSLSEALQGNNGD